MTLLPWMTPLALNEQSSPDASAARVVRDPDPTNERPNIRTGVGAMRNRLTAFAGGPLLLAVTLAPMVLASAALAQQSGGTLRVGHFTSPASVSMLEESTAA